MLFSSLSVAFGQNDMRETKSGLRYKVVSPGKGEKPSEWDLVEIHLAGEVVGGISLVDSRKSGAPLKVLLGRGAVPKGLEEGIQIMHLGAKYVFEVPPGLAYGAAGTDIIPSNATLRYQVELKAIKEVFKPFKRLGQDTIYLDNGLKYVAAKEGAGLQVLPNEQVSIHYYMMLPDGTILDSSWDTGHPLSFLVGNRAVIDGLDQGLVFLREGAELRLFIPAELAYGSKGFGEVVPSNQPLVCDIQIVKVR